MRDQLAIQEQMDFSLDSMVKERHQIHFQGQEDGGKVTVPMPVWLRI